MGEPIYEKLAPGEVLIISKGESDNAIYVTYVTNEDGKLSYKKVILKK